MASGRVTQGVFPARLLIRVTEDDWMRVVCGSPERHAYPVLGRHLWRSRTHRRPVKKSVDLPEAAAL